MGMKTDKSPKGNRVSSGMKDMNIEYRRKSQGSALHNRLIFTFSFHYFSHYIPCFEEFFCILHSLSRLFKAFQKSLIQFEEERLSNGFKIFAYFLRTKLRFLKMFFHNGNFRRPSQDTTHFRVPKAKVIWFNLHIYQVAMLLSTTYFDGFNSILHVWENVEVRILRFYVLKGDFHPYIHTFLLTRVPFLVLDFNSCPLGINILRHLLVSKKC